MSTTTWTYGASITRERGDFVVSVRDLPEVVTSGSTQEEALELAADAIEVIVEGRMEDNEALPLPSRVRRPAFRKASSRAGSGATKPRCAAPSTRTTAPSSTSSRKPRERSGEGWWCRSRRRD